MKQQFEMERGEPVAVLYAPFCEQPPVVSVMGNDRLAYLWVGGKRGTCYATLSGYQTLRALRTAITKALRLAKPKRQAKSDGARPPARGRMTSRRRGGEFIQSVA